MPKKRNVITNIFKEIFVSPDYDFVGEARQRFKTDKKFRDLYGDSRSNRFWWLDTVIEIAMHILRGPIIIVLYFALGWLLLQCLDFIL